MIADITVDCEWHRADWRKSTLVPYYEARLYPALNNSGVTTRTAALKSRRAGPFLTIVQRVKRGNQGRGNSRGAGIHMPSIV